MAMRGSPPNSRNTSGKNWKDYRNTWACAGKNWKNYDSRCSLARATPSRVAFIDEAVPGFFRICVGTGCRAQVEAGIITSCNDFSVDYATTLNAAKRIAFSRGANIVVMP